METTVLAYVVAELKLFGIVLSSMDQTALLIRYNLAEADVLAEATLPIAIALIASHIAKLLAMPDVTEGGYAAKWDRTAVLRYYNALCREWELPNYLETPTVVAVVPTISDRSYLW